MQKADLHLKLSKGQDVDDNAAQLAANATEEAMDEFDKIISKDPIAKRAHDLASAQKMLEQRLMQTTASDSEKIVSLAEKEKQAKQEAEAKKAKEAAEKKAKEEAEKKAKALAEK